MLFNILIGVGGLVVGFIVATIVTFLKRKKLEELWKEMADEAADFWKKAVRGVQEQLDEVTTSVEGAMDNAIGVLESALNDLNEELEAIEEKAEEGMDDIKEAILEEMAAIQAKLDALKNL